MLTDRTPGAPDGSPPAGAKPSIPLGPFRLGASDTACMKKELPEAIKALEKKAGVPERRSRRGR